MRKIPYYLLSALLMLVSCQKEKVNAPADQSTTSNSQIVSLVTPGPNTGTLIQEESSGILSRQDSVTVAGLISSNNLSINGLAIYGYQTYNAYNQDNVMTNYQIVMTSQIVNGLPVFNHDVNIVFEDGKFQGPLPSAPYMVGQIALDSKPNLSTDTVRNIFIRTDDAKEAQSINVASMSLTAQLEYYDLNTGFPQKGTNFVKAWLVQPQGGGFPMAYIRDDNKEIIQFHPLTHSGPVGPGGW